MDPLYGSEMASDYSGFDDGQVKHLEMVQTVIARLANDSFLVKGWAITVAGVFFGFAFNTHSRRLSLASLIPILIFWGLDAYFLRSERLFRCLYKKVLRRQVDPFHMSATSPDFINELDKDEKWAASRTGAFRSFTLTLFYGTLVASALLVTALVKVPEAG